MKKAVTIHDIAKAAGVAPGTVSRTINNIGYVSQDTRSRIEQAVQESEFTPNRAARTLKTRKTGLILLAMPDTDNPFYTGLILATQKVLKRYRYSLLLYFTEGREHEEIHALQMLQERYADGMILINLRMTQRLIETINQSASPLVISCISAILLGGQAMDHYDYVGVDSEKGMYQLTLHFIRQGHTRIGYIGGFPDADVFTERYRGYCRALADNHLALDPSIVHWGGNVEADGIAAAEHFLADPHVPTAVCSANDIMAIGALRTFETQGLRVPGDLAIAGMGDIDLGTHIRPRLTSVALAQSDIGQTAAEILMKRLHAPVQEPCHRVIFEPRLVVRESSVDARFE